MTEQEMTECLRLLTAADDILIVAGEHVIAAHITMAIALLREGVRANA